MPSQDIVWQSALKDGITIKLASIEPPLPSWDSLSSLRIIAVLRYLIYSSEPRSSVPLQARQYLIKNGGFRLFLMPAMDKGIPFSWSSCHLPRPVLRGARVPLTALYHKSVELKGSSKIIDKVDRWWSWGLERSRDLLEVTQLVGGGAGPELDQVFLTFTPETLLFHQAWKGAGAVETLESPYCILQ